MLLLIDTKFIFWLTAVYLQAYSVLFNYWLPPFGISFYALSQFNDIIFYIADKLDSVRDHFESCIW